jgi:hypothetical protein
MAAGRTGSSGYVVKTGTSSSDYVLNRSGFVTRNTGGNLSTMVPSYAMPSLNYSGPIKSAPSGGIVQVAKG